MYLCKAEMNREFHYSNICYLNNQIFKSFVNYMEYITQNESSSYLQQSLSQSAIKQHYLML